MTKFEHLFKYYQPTNYNLTLEIDRAKRQFNGKIIISGKTKTDEKIVKLHANYLEIESIKITDQSVDFDYQDNILSFINSENQPIEIIYNGKITDQMNGIYPCYYNHQDQPHEVIATQFESHYAREVFPHIDEPIAKATFDLTLITETNKTVLANTEVLNQTENNNQLITTFKTTPLMSSYTLAFVVGDFIKKSGTSKNGTTVNVWTTINQAPNQLDFPLDIAIKALDFYEEYLGVKFPLTKCDHVALPDFAAGAMENWGLITYREGMFLATESSSIATKKTSALVIAHELAHMWFGNLVTMRWWDELWLNESLASVMEYLAVDAIKPEYKVWQDFYNQSYLYAQTKDSIAGVQSVLTPINHPDEISAAFDGAIVYAKGACLMLMLKNLVGDDIFRSSIAAYLEKNAYKNPDSVAFLSEFDARSDYNISDFMNTWLNQAGFPLITVKQEDDKIKISQQSFLKDDKLWPVPLFIDGQEILLTEKEVILNQTDLPLVNQAIKGYYAVRYQDEILNKINHPLDIFYYLNNQNLLAKNQYIDSGQLVDDFMKFSDSDQLLIWRALNKIASSIIFLVQQTPAESKFKQLINQSNLINILDKIGYIKRDSDDSDTIELRNIVLSLLSYADNQAVIDYCHQIFERTKLQDLDKLDSELRYFVLSNQLEHYFKRAEFDKLFKLYQTTADPSLTYDLQSALTDIKDAKAGSYLLKMMNDQNIIKAQDLGFWFVYLLRNRWQQDQTWDWLKANFDRLRKLFSENKDYAELVSYSGAILYSDKQQQEYIDAFKPYQNDLALTRIYQVGLNAIKDKNNLYKKHTLAVQNKLVSVSNSKNKRS